MLYSKRRREILHELVAEVRAFIGEPLHKRNEGVEVLIQNIGRTFSIRFLVRSQEDVTREVILALKCLPFVGSMVESKKPLSPRYFTIGSEVATASAPESRQHAKR